VTEIILVHGIGQEQRSADWLESQWLPSLAGGVRTAGHPELADALWRYARPGAPTTRMAYYADLFRRADQQGSAADVVGFSTPDRQRVIDDLLAELIANAGARAQGPNDQREVEQALRVLRGDVPDTQGLGVLARPLLNALLRIGPFARLGHAVAERFLVAALRQVTLYLTDPEIRQAAQQRVLSLVDVDTKVVIAHSLGTVVAFEALHRVDHPIPLLITLGSPLGMRTLIHGRLHPQPACVPPTVKRWVNIADRDDLVASTLDLTPLFAGGDGVLENHSTVDNGSKPHEATYYLGKAVVGGPLAEVCHSGDGLGDPSATSASA
jgi:hypothetical protein